MNGAILVAGTSSDAGKSVLVAGLCRWLARRGVRVAPFKAQNMSLNSAVTPDGAEIGRAQFAQAQAAGARPEAAMNPVLLKPTSERASEVVVLGRPLTHTDARSYPELRDELAPIVLAALASLRSRFDVVVCEGAGSLAEPNLRDRDLVNMGLARAARLPVVVVADIDRGGAFAGLLGSLALLEPADQALVSGFVLNRFRGDPAIVQPAINDLLIRTGRPMLGLVPWTAGLALDAEDSLALRAGDPDSVPPVGHDAITVAVVRLPHISNFTDVDALGAEPGVAVHFTESPSAVRAADLVIIPGTKATVADLAWIRQRRLDRTLRERTARSRPVLGICGGYQLLGRRVVDTIESGAGEVAGLDLLPVETVFEPGKTLATPTGRARLGDVAVAGYEIHRGRVCRLGGDPLIDTSTGDEGCRVGGVLGTSWHGVLENDEFRRALLGWVATCAGLDWVPGDRSFAAVREARHDGLAQLIDRHLDTEAIALLIDEGPPSGLPTVTATPSPEPVPVPPELRVHGDRVTTADLNFAVNVQPELPTSMKAAIAAAIEGIGSYPDESAAAGPLAERHDRAPDEILPTNGSAEAFWLVAAAFHPRRAVVVHPTFTEPEVALQTLGRPVERCLRDPEDFSLDPEAVPEDADLVLVGNPNNPTGTLDPAATVERLARPGRILVIDEAFMPFVPGEPATLTGRSFVPGLVVIRSITKLWAVPGLRAGYVVAPADLIARLRDMRQPWSTNSIALAALVAAARDETTPVEAVRTIAHHREALAARLAVLPGVRVWPSATNFLLIRVPDGTRVRARLDDRGIAIRPAESFPGLTADHFRVAVRHPTENDVLVAALHEAIGAPSYPASVHSGKLPPSSA
ncbi:MAG: cobyric acid synthase [Acidimicrobiales bacterium]